MNVPIVHAASWVAQPHRGVLQKMNWSICSREFYPECDSGL